MPTFKIPTINELIEAIKADAPIFYHAPMDAAPAMIRVLQYTIVPNNPEHANNRITMSCADINALVIPLVKYLDRFRLKTQSVEAPSVVISRVETLSPARYRLHVRNAGLVCISLHLSEDRSHYHCFVDSSTIADESLVSRVIQRYRETELS